MSWSIPWNSSTEGTVFTTCMLAPCWRNPWESPIENEANIPYSPSLLYLYYGGSAYHFKFNHKSIYNRVFSRPSCMPVVAMEIVGQTNQRSVTVGVQALSAHYIMLIRPPQALSLVRIYRKLFIFKYIF